MMAGIFVSALGLFYAVFKYSVIRYAARDIYNGGGVPIMDFVVIVPVFLAGGLSLLLKQANHYPFTDFGVLVYVGLAVVFYLIIKLEYHLGKSERIRQLNEIKAKKMGGQA